MIKILLLIDYSSDFDRKLLQGLIKYAKENASWLFYRLPSYYVTMHGSLGVLEWAKKWKASAIIGKWTDESIDLQKELNIPVVVQNYHHRSSSYSNLTGDYKGTGKMAAQFFIERNFHNFAFFGIKGVIWSDERCKGYVQEIERAGGNFFCFETEQQEDDSRAEITCWLQQLPKPIALFCCDDVHALFISETCKMAEIRIPEEIALLGVDNDELMCNISDPPISSIELGIEQGGYMMGKLIDKQLRQEYNGNFNIVINPIRIELRQSTEKYNIEDPHVLEVVRLIDSSYNSDLSIETLLSHIPLSRRNLEIKFKRVMHVSIYQYILLCRCNRLAHLLLTTKRSLRDLSIEVGFKDYNNVTRIFKKYKNCSPSEYRQRNEAV